MISEQIKRAFEECEEGAITVSEFLNFTCSKLPSHEVADWLTAVTSEDPEILDAENEHGENNALPQD